MPVRIFVGNFPYDATEAELREHFSAVGKPGRIYLPTDRQTGRPRGFAFIEFEVRAEAEEAIRRFNDKPFKGRPLVVNEARERDDRPRPSFGAQQSSSRPPSLREPASAESLSRGGSRPSGTEAAPRRSRGKAKKGSDSERSVKGPMREVVRSRFFGMDDDEPYDDDLDEENFASRVSDSDEDENT